MDLFSWNKFISFIKSEEFIVYGVFIFYIIVPLFFLTIGAITSFIIDYNEFKDWKNNNLKE